VCVLQNVEIDSDGYLIVERYRERERARKINLKRDAGFKGVERVEELNDRYMLELKLKRRLEQRSIKQLDTEMSDSPKREVKDEGDKLVMLRYVSFSHFNQTIYPLAYIIIMRRVIGQTLAQQTL
jgi:IS5 family transposase